MKGSKRVLVLNFFPAFVPPKSGGELRYFYFYRELSRTFDVTLLSPTYAHHRDERIDHSPTFREYRVPKEALHDELHARLDQEGIGQECSALVCALSCRHPNAYHRRYLELYPRADIIVHEFPYMLEYDLFFGHDGKPRIYNSHNFESRLAEQLWTGPNAAPYLERVQHLERRLACGSDLVFAVSADEREAMIRTFDLDPERVHVAANGVDPGSFPRPAAPWPPGQRPKALFVGSQHPPNIEAAQFIASELAPACPDIEFLIAGSCCRNFPKPDAPNVRLLGPFGEGEKEDLFRQAQIAVNPLFAGAGTNLKALEFMAAGLPLFATDVGARGLEIEDGVHFILCSRTDMAGKLNELSRSGESLKNLAEAARRHVRDRFSWPRIVSRFAAKVGDLPERKAVKPLLALNDFPVHGGRFGGAVRIQNLYSVLSRRHPLLLVTLNNGSTIETRSLGPRFTELSFPKTPEHIREENKENCCWDVSVNDIVTSYMAPTHELLRATVRCGAGSAAAVILVHPYMSGLLEEVDRTPVIYEAHNFEYRLKAGFLHHHPRKEAHLEQVRKAEQRAVERSDLLICVSLEDGRAITDFYHSGKEFIVIPNGVDTQQLERVAPLCRRPTVQNLFHRKPVVVFVGSGHRPNIEGVRFIIERLAPVIDDAYFCVIGDVCRALSENLPDNVVFMDRLPEPHKNVLLALADAAVNPVWEGSGSNLKLAEYFSFGLPTVTSDFGARGYQVMDGREVLVATPDNFAERLAQLLADRPFRRRLAQQARRFVAAHHDWSRLGRHVLDVLENRLFGRDATKVLVITHRFTRPPLGGAERYLLHLLEGITRTAAIRFDIVCPAVHQVNNRFHFATSLNELPGAPLEIIGPRIALRRFPFQTLVAEHEEELCRKLFHQWYGEFIRISLAHLADYPRPMLLGGWNFPEKQDDGTTRIWTSKRSLLHVSQSRSVRITGFSSKRKALRFIGDQHELRKKTVFGNWSVDLATEGIRVLELAVDRPHHEKGDPRSLGVLVRSIGITDIRGETRELPLDRDYRDWLKQHRLKSYISRVIEVTRERPKEMEEAFQAVRGPHSREMTEWIQRHAADYDLIFGHCMPFHPIVEATRTAAQVRKPLLLLPHFHFDDEFYHWHIYYRTLQQADIVAAFPQRSLALFFEPLGAAARSLPGGGVLPEEFEVDHQGELRRLYHPDTPYFLVLGRKSASKNYRWVIDAVHRLNQAGTSCELLMIGPDDDGLVLEQSHVTYLGEQPREVVLGALQGCAALVNMSSSESFGIVILEAWMAHKPVVVNRHCTAFRELVDPDSDGCLTTREQLAECLGRLLQDPQRAAAMGQAGRQKVSRDYTWDSIASRVARWIESLTS